MSLDPVALLEGLLGIFSPSNDEAEAASFLVGQMQMAGFGAWVDEAGNAVGVLGDGPADIVLLGHIDTVPGFIPVRREGDLLYGRGAVDAKGPLAAFVSAVAEVGPLPDRRFVVIGAAGEEGDSHGAQHVADRYYGPGGLMARNNENAPVCLIIGEPSGWDRVTLGYKGSAWLDYTVQRPVAHSAAKEESACDVAFGFWGAVTRYAVEYNISHQAERAFDQLSTTLRAMRSQSDGFQQTAELSANLRLPPGLSVAALTDTSEELAEDAELRVQPGAMPAYRAEKNTPLVRAFLSAIRASNGKPSFTVKTGSSDMNLVAPGWGCPAVAYGPGDFSLDHTPDEHVSIAEYHQGIKVLVPVLESRLLTST